MGCMGCGSGCERKRPPGALLGGAHQQRRTLASDEVASVCCPGQCPDTNTGALRPLMLLTWLPPTQPPTLSCAPAPAAYNQLKTAVEKSDAWCAWMGVQADCLLMRMILDCLGCLCRWQWRLSVCRCLNMLLLLWVGVVRRRYHVLCGHGGVYADTDTICGKPVESWAQFNTTPEPGLIVGIENRFHR